MPPAGLSIKCPKCKTPFTVHRPKPGERKAVTSKVPLPGTGTPAPGQPAQRATGGRVPLPGAQFASAPTPPPRTGASDEIDPFASPAAPETAIPGDDGSQGPAFSHSQAPAQSDLDAAFAPSANAIPDDETALTPKREVEETDLAPKGPGPGHDSGQPPSFAQEAADVSFDFVDARPPTPPSPPPPAPASSGDSPELLDFVDEQPKPASKPARGAPPPVIAPASAQPKKADKKRNKKARPASAPVFANVSVYFPCGDVMLTVADVASSFSDVVGADAPVPRTCMK